MENVVFLLKPWAEVAWLLSIAAALAIAVGSMRWQSRLQGEKLRYDLFEKRFEIHRSLQHFIHKLMSNGSVATADVEALTKHAVAVEFLFRPKIASFMNEAYHKALDLEVWGAMRSKRGQELPESEKKRYQETVRWFSTHATAQLKQFSRDLELCRQRRFLTGATRLGRWFGEEENSYAFLTFRRCSFSYMNHRVSEAPTVNPYP